jgi:hypothetical protein
MMPLNDILLVARPTCCHWQGLMPPTNVCGAGISIVYVHMTSTYGSCVTAQLSSKLEHKADHPYIIALSMI